MGETDQIVAYSDANWGACRTTRKSTTGGVLRVGSHTIKTFSKTQANIATSSAESEVTAMMKAASEALGLAGLMEDFGGQPEQIILNVDASAAMEIASREGVGRTRHIDVAILWLQQEELQERLKTKKIDVK